MKKPQIYQEHILAILKLLRSIECHKVLMDGGTAFDCGTWFWATDYKPANSIVNALPQGTTPLRARAVMKRLDDEGLISGCHCGCRGSYILTAKGRKLSNNDQIYFCFH